MSYNGTENHCSGGNNNVGNSVDVMVMVVGLVEMTAGVVMMMITVKMVAALQKVAVSVWE